MGRAGLAARAGVWACSGSLELCAAAQAAPRPAARIAARALAAAFVALAFAGTAHGAPSLVTLGSFSSPTFAGAPAGDTTRVFVTERPGRVRLVLDGVVQPTPFLDVAATTNSGYQERGLLSIAFAPDYVLSGHFYIYRTNLAGDNEIWEYTRSLANPNVADADSGRLLLTISHPDAENHNGGQLQFGPDGRLYVGTGDGGGGGDQYHHAQDPVVAARQALHAERRDRNADDRLARPA